MKKKIFMVLFTTVLCLVLVGCGKKDTIKKVKGEWNVSVSNTIQDDFFEEELKKVFTDATKDYETTLKPIVLMGKQVVAGTNYMFLCVTDKEELKVVTIYNDLEGYSKISSVNDFDVKKYVNQNYELDTEQLAGGWYTEKPGKINMLDEKTQTIFEEATQIIGVSYYPVSVLATQEKEGTSYAILCYGVLSDPNSTTGMFVLTIKVDASNKTTLESIAAVDLKEFNK